MLHFPGKRRSLKWDIVVYARANYALYSFDTYDYSCATISSVRVSKKIKNI